MTSYGRLYADLGKGELYISELRPDPAFRQQLFSGVSLKGMAAPTAVVKNASGKKNDLLYALGMGRPIVSERARSFLERSADAPHFEFFSIAFENKKLPPYLLLNIMQPVDAFDWERSRYELFDGPGPTGNKVIRDLARMEIDASKTNNRQLFVLLGHEGHTIIHQDLTAGMRSAGLTGLLVDPLWGHTS